MSFTLLLLLYLSLVSIYAAYLFTQDKRRAQQNQRRISERQLHYAELAGGVFSVVMLMFLIRHKNQKSAYFIVTYAILCLWLVILYWYFFY